MSDKWLDRTELFCAVMFSVVIPGVLGVALLTVALR